MRFLVFQHIAIEHPGIFRDFLAADGIDWDAVELDAGEEIPPLDGYDALWVMGGPMDVWEEDQHPWLVAEKRAIRAAVERGLPYMGVCLGHQLLGAAMGGRVGKAAQAEVGILDVALTEAGRRDPLFAGMAPVFKALQWHGAEVAAAPPGATVLAQSPLCGVQAMRVGRWAYGLQYHTELTAEHGGRVEPGARLCLLARPDARRRGAAAARRRGAPPHGGLQSRFAPALRQLHDADRLARASADGGAAAGSGLIRRASHHGRLMPAGAAAHCSRRKRSQSCGHAPFPVDVMGGRTPCPLSCRCGRAVGHAAGEPCGRLCCPMRRSSTT